MWGESVKKGRSHRSCEPRSPLRLPGDFFTLLFQKHYRDVKTVEGLLPLAGTRSTCYQLKLYSQEIGVTTENPSTSPDIGLMVIPFTFSLPFPTMPTVVKKVILIVGQAASVRWRAEDSEIRIALWEISRTAQAREDFRLGPLSLLFLPHICAHTCINHVPATMIIVVISLFPFP